MKTAEAKEKWCPMRRIEVVTNYGTGGIAASAVNSGAKCIANGCMMWRWNVRGEAGYCGLAGRPHVD